MTYIIIKRDEDGYYIENFSNDHYISNIFDLISDIGSKSLIRFLQSNEPGFRSNSWDVDFIDDKVLIKPLYVDDADLYQIEINRNLLLSLALKWQELIKKGVHEIIITRDQNGTISITGS